MLNQTEVKSLSRPSFNPDAPTVVIDADETIWGVLGPYINEINRIMGTDHKPEHVTRYDICGVLDVPQQVFYDVLMSDAFSKPEIYIYAKQFLRKLREGGFNHMFGVPAGVQINIALVTLRGFRLDGFKITHDLLVAHDLYFDVLTALPMTKSKLDYADAEFNDLIGIIDDSPNNLREFRMGGYLPICALAPWNQHLYEEFPNRLDLANHPGFLEYPSS
jgi:hypothetical protein